MLTSSQDPSFISHQKDIWSFILLESSSVSCLLSIFAYQCLLLPSPGRIYSLHLDPWNCWVVWQGLSKLLCAVFYSKRYNPLWHLSPSPVLLNDYVSIFWTPPIPCSVFPKRTNWNLLNKFFFWKYSGGAVGKCYIASSGIQQVNELFFSSISDSIAKQSSRPIPFLSFYSFYFSPFVHVSNLWELNLSLSQVTFFSRKSQENLLRTKRVNTVMPWKLHACDTNLCV